MNASEGTGKITSVADMTAGFLLFPGVEELDFAGPWEMFSIWSAYADGPKKCVNVSESGGNVRCAKGLRINADLDFESCPRLDVLLVPGGEGVYREVENSKLIEFVSNQAVRCSYILAVCTGTFILAKAGLLKGRRATTHWASLNRLRAIHGVEVTEERYVHDGPVWTAAGVSAGLDMALAFISLEGGGRKLQELSSSDRRIIHQRMTISSLPLRRRCRTTSTNGRQKNANKLPETVRALSSGRQASNRQSPGSSSSHPGCPQVRHSRYNRRND